MSLLVFLLYFIILIVSFLFLKKKFIDLPNTILPIPALVPLNMIAPPLLDNTTCLVTGGGGSLGRFLVEKILEGNQFKKVKIFDSVKTWTPPSDRVEYIVGNLIYPEDVNKAVAGCGTVIHLAGVIDVRSTPLHRAKIYNPNVVGTHNVINACLLSGTRSLVYMSTIGMPSSTQENPATEETKIYLLKPSIYVETKWKAEAAVLAANGYGHLHTASLRSNTVWGYRDRFIYSEAIKPQTLYLPNPSSKFQPHSITSLDSLIGALLSTCLRLDTTPGTVGGQFYYIADKGSYNYVDLIQKIGKKFGVKKVFQELSPGFWKIVVVGVPWFDWLTGGRLNWFMLQLTEDTVKSTRLGLWISTDKAKRDLGFVPLSLEDAMELLVKKCKQEKEKKE